MTGVLQVRPEVGAAWVQVDTAASCSQRMDFVWVEIERLRFHGRVDGFPQGRATIAPGSSTLLCPNDELIRV